MPMHSADVSGPIAASNLPIPRSQPGWLATVARMRGLEPADPGAARVLELGCASGRNLIPLADRYPDSTFVGIANSARQIAAAAEAVAAVGLQNVEFRNHDLVGLDSELGTFDYIIAERTYSMVDDARRDRLLAICRDHLAPQGVAYVGYSTYPGCRIHDLLASMMQYSARSAPISDQRVARARELLEFLKNTLTGDNPYHTLLQRELTIVAAQDDVSLGTAYLEGWLRPVYFSNFLAHANRHALQYLGDCAVGIRYTERLDEPLEAGLSRVADNAMQREQYRDILRNRRYRQTLLCHADRHLDTSLSRQDLEGMYLEAPFKLDARGARIDSAMMERFAARGGRYVSTAAPLIKAALVHLNETWPEYILVDDLVVGACRRLEEASPSITISDADRDRLRDNLVECCASGVMAVHAHAEPFTARVSARPKASRFARWQTARGEAPASRRHESVTLDGGDAHVLGLLDGTRDAEALLEALVAAADEGHLGLVNQELKTASRERIRELLAAELLESLARLSQHALLVE